MSATDPVCLMCQKSCASKVRVSSPTNKTAFLHPACHDKGMRLLFWWGALTDEAKAFIASAEGNR